MNLKNKGLNQNKKFINPKYKTNKNLFKVLLNGKINMDVLYHRIVYLVKIFTKRYLIYKRNKQILLKITK